VAWIVAVGGDLKIARKIGSAQKPDDEPRILWQAIPSMAEELIRPIDENTAKAIEESAKTLGKGLDLAGGLGAYLRER